MKDLPVPVKAVVFDLDGTFMDTVPDLIDAANDMLEELKLPPIDEATIKTYVGNGLVRMVKRLLSRGMSAEPDEVLFAHAMPIYEKHYAQRLYSRSKIFEGVLEGLDLMQERGFRLGCVTNKAERFTVPLLEAAGLLKYFDLVVAGDTLPKQKPDPLQLQHACSYFGVQPEEMLLIGDSPNDVLAARSAGCHIFCVSYGYSQGQDVHTLGADAVIPSFVEAVNLIRKV